jgi:Domain of unknown function (DUF3526)
MVVAWIVSGFWFHLAIWVVALTAYCAFWVTVSIVISVRTPLAASGFVVGASTWLGLAVVVPSLANLSAPLFAPADSISFVNAERAASLDINARIDAALITLSRNGTFPSDILKQPPAGLSRPEIQQAIARARIEMFEERLAPVLQQLHLDERKLDRVTSILRFCSPAMLFESISDDLAGTGRVRWRRFLEQMDAHVR